MEPNDDGSSGDRVSIGVRRRLRAALALTFTCLLVVSAIAIGSVGAPTGTATAASGTSVDVVLVIDRSGSMEEDWDDLAHEMGGIDDYLDDQGVDARYTVVSYEESPRIEQGWTDDFDHVESSLDFATEGGVENASAAILEATSLSTPRADADRVVVLVTDEDDDGTAAQRDEAKSALSSARLVTVSPADPAASNCSNYQVLCDDDASNELRRLAEDVDGDWIDVHAPAREIVEDTGASVETAATGSSSLGTAPASSGGSDLQVTNLSVNRSTVEVGEPVGVAATVANGGSSAGTFDALFADETGLIETRSIEVPPGTVRTVRFNHTYVEPENYELFVTHRFAGRLEVIPRPETSVETRTSANGSTLVANVSDPRTNTSVTVPLDDLVSPRDDVTVEALTVTPADDEDFAVNVSTRSTPANGTPRLPTGVRPVSYLTADASTTVAEGDNATTAFEYTAATEGAHLYRYEPNGSGWTVLDAESTNESGDRSRLVATSPGLSHFALGVEEPAFEVTRFDVAATAVDSGDPIEATVTVANEGKANGTYAATLVADGEVVDRTEVFVPVGESRRVDLGFVRHAAGDVRVSVDEGQETTVTVRDGSDGGGEVAGTGTAESTTGTDGQPGFGAPLVVAVLLGLALLAVRRQ